MNFAAKSIKLMDVWISRHKKSSSNKKHLTRNKKALMNWAQNAMSRITRSFSWKNNWTRSVNKCPTLRSKRQNMMWPSSWLKTLLGNWKMLKLKYNKGTKVLQRWLYALKTWAEAMSNKSKESKNLLTNELRCNKTSNLKYFKCKSESRN